MSTKGCHQESEADCELLVLTRTTFEAPETNIFGRAYLANTFYGILCKPIGHFNGLKGLKAKET